MDEKLRGSFPGAPSKTRPVAERTTAPRLSRVEDRERRSAVRQQGHARARRKKRFVVGLVVSLIAAGGTGLYFEKLSHVTLEEIRAEQETVTGGTHRWLTSERFDLLLLDIELLRMKRVEFLSWALSRDPEMAVIMLTGLDIPEVAIECMDQGARTYLVKPIEVDFLRLALRDALGLRRVLLERNDLAGRA